MLPKNILLLNAQDLGLWELLTGPWHWAFSGFMITLVLFLLVWMGKSFGVSSSFKDLCNLAGAGKKVPYFDFDIKEEYWRLSFVVGGLIGGFIAFHFMQSPNPVDISVETRNYLATLGMSYPESDLSGQGFVPTEIFNFSSFKGILLALIGGVLVGFGTRYGKGCTSGHAITGLAHLQLPSLITVIGFFIGGLIMTHFILPYLIVL